MRMSTSKKIELSIAGSANADAIVREITKAENKFQEELNRAFVALAENSFKGLRRQLPVTRQRVEWEKIGGYRVSASTDLSPVEMLFAADLTLFCSWAKILVEAVPSDESLR